MELLPGYVSKLESPNNRRVAMRKLYDIIDTHPEKGCDRIITSATPFLAVIYETPAHRDEKPRRIQRLELKNGRTINYQIWRDAKPKHTVVKFKAVTSLTF